MAKVTGIRIQKVLSDNGILSRRKAEEAIRQGRVTVNGRPAVPGNPVNPARDVIAIDGVKVALQRKKHNVYIMLHKPRGFVTTTADEMGRRCVTDLVEDAPARVYPVGRLDRNSEGLLLMTNDGAFANMVTPGCPPRHNISSVPWSAKSPFGISSCGKNGYCLLTVPIVVDQSFHTLSQILQFGKIRPIPGAGRGKRWFPGRGGRPP